MEKTWQVENITSEIMRQPSQPPPRYDSDVRQFLDDQLGFIVILSEDALFIKTVRTSMLRALQVKRNCVESYRDPSQAISTIRQQVRTRVPVLVLADRLLAGKPSTDFLRKAKQLFPTLKLIVMTYETTKETLALLHEIGVDHVITKPVSVDTLIEKIAGVIRPQSKISQLVQNARICLEQCDFDKVFKFCDTILGMKEKSAIALMLRGEAFMRNGNREEALEEFEKAHNTSPLYLEPLKKLAEVHRGGDETQFLHYMLQLDSISPLNVERKCEIGKCYVRRMETHNAKEFFDKAIEYAHMEAKSYLCATISDIANAIIDIAPELSEQYFTAYFSERGDNLSKEDMVAFNSYGMALRKQGKWREALENYKTALTIDPEDMRILYNYALAYADGEQHAKAIELYQQVLSKDPQFHRKAAVISYNIANSYYNTKDNKNALKYVQEALEIDPEHQSSKKLLERLS